MDLFISYARKDRARVNKIAAALEAEGYTVWWDRHIRAGKNFQSEIAQHLKQAKAVVVVWSKHSVESHWVQDEARHGVQQEALVPVMIDEVASPLGFGHIHASELFDGGDDPTSSSEWPEFLHSVRELVGEGGQAADDTASQESAIRQTAPATPTPSISRQSASAPAWKRYWPAAASVVGLLVAGLVALQLFGGNLMGPPDPEDMTPVVLGIYPDESFGEDQRLGVSSAFADSEIDVIHLTASLDAMKGRNAPELIDALAANLERRNVIAIVGPSITELTPEVLDTVEASGRNPAIILTTAAPRQAIGWDDRDLPLFRVGSGVDERARQFAMLARGTIEDNSELVLLYETVPNSTEKTYGEVFYDRIKDHLPQWNEWLRDGKVHDISYVRGRVMSSFERAEQLGHFDENKMIVVVGLSSDYIVLVTNLYRQDQPARAALLGGWNTSKTLQDLGRQIDIQSGRLFDMTDVDASPAEAQGLADSRRFVRDFGELDPAKRQEAVAYDSALVVKHAAAGIEGQITADQIVEILRGQSFMGVTGEITFAQNGQNAGRAGGRTLHNLRYEPSTERWSVIPRFDTLLEREVALASD